VIAPKPEVIADNFRQVLQGWLSPVELRCVDDDNSRETSPYVCHSHDHCDANMAMVEAMERFDLPWPTDEDGEIRDEEYSEAHCALWNEAWEIAMRSGFSVLVGEG
tara:strand:- start:953 stop:1270 length:318 start_codon:yes stop_codon:yes gene_type:complete